METKVLMQIGLEFIQVAVQAYMRGQREVAPEDIEQAKQRAKRSRGAFQDAVADHEAESEDDAS